MNERQENENRTVSPMERVLAEYENMMSDPTEDKPTAKKEAPDAHLYLDEMGLQHAIEDTQAQGGFYIKPTRRHLTKVCVGLTVPSVVLTALVLAFLDLMLIKAPERAQSIIIFILILEGLTVLAVACIILYHCITKTRGRLYKYRADGLGFYEETKAWDKVTGTKQLVVHQEQIFFKDVRGVAYTPTTRLNGDYGYSVDIIMTYGTVHFDYIFPHFKHSIPTKDLPFEVIKRNIPRQDDTD